MGSAWYIKRNQEYVREAKDMQPCLDCAVPYPYYVMQFDHRGEVEKFKNVSRMSGSTWSLARLQEEMDKCDLVCANCHMERSFQRQFTPGE